MNHQSIDILMATYNGEQYLCSQLDSILWQSNQNWRLIIRDDSSTDNTVQILQEYQRQYPNQIVLLQADVPSGSAQNNFFQLIQYWQTNSKANYVMLSDQDDVWLPDKIQITFDKMQQMEQQYSAKVPLLVHTDLTVVDETLKQLDNSLFHMQHMDAKRDQFHHILTQNIVTGCTMMGNRALLDRISVLPQYAIMHDMWLALIASAFGSIGFVDEATLLYRQHSNNANGAKNVKTLQYFLWKLTSAEEIHQGLVKQYRQAEEFLQIYQAELGEKQKKMLQAYSAMEEKNIIEKFVTLRKYELYKNGFVRVMGQILR